MRRNSRRSKGNSGATRVAKTNTDNSFDILSGKDINNSYDYIASNNTKDVKEAIRNYTGGFSEDINRIAEYGKVSGSVPNKEYINKRKQDYTTLKKLLDNAPSLVYNTDLRRTMTLNHPMNKLKVGDKGKTKSFLSSSGDERWYSYGGKQSTILFKAKKGKKVGLYLGTKSYNPNEAEFLINKGVPYKVKSKKPNKTGGYDFVMELG